MRCWKRLPGLGFLTVSLSTSAWAQAPEVKLRAGDPVIGMGTQIALGSVAINDAGVWLAAVQTDFPLVNRDEALLRNGVVTLREGSLIPSPNGATIRSFDSMSIVRSGHLALAMEFNVPGGGGNSGVFWNTLLLAREADLVNAPEVPADTVWSTFKTVLMNESNTILVAGELNNLAVSGTKEPMVARFQVSDSGQLLATNVIASKGTRIEAFPTNLFDIADREHAIALNRRGDYMFIAKPTGSGPGTGTSIVLNGETVLAQEGVPSSFGGREFVTLFSRVELDLNDFGEYVYTGNLDTGSVLNSEFVVVKNGVLFAVEDEIIPSLGASLEEGVSAPIFLSNGGDVYWMVQTESGRAYLRNRDLIVREGDSVGGNLVTILPNVSHAFHTSDDGRFWVGRVTFHEIGDSMLLADFGMVVPVPGCAGNQGRLRLTSGFSIAGARMRFELDSGQGAGVVPMLIASLGPAIPGSECGIPTRAGELLISPQSRISVVFGPTWLGGAVPIFVDIPNQLALVDVSYHAQGLFWDANHLVPGERLRLTNAIRGEIGAP